MEVLKQKYLQEVVPTMMKRFGYKNPMAVPKIEKIIVNVGVSEAVQNPGVIESVAKDLSTITGQKPLVRKARKSIANFHLRKGIPIGLKVTLRGDRMYAFLYKLINVALPRVRDFSGLSTNSFDGRGNYSLGLKEQLVFPEIEYDKIDRIRGMDITVVTNAKTDEEAKELLALLGMPFKK
ncbi:MAG TPA: 50S ribosomal protein L5 [Dictyoglomaceae bacterium]|nr:50S ribosomal protein L5 [Dictyoglomaceae bacterium]HOL38826.1 50S ribosomal protein L5 [Dictyoglomaceae bacterium]HOP94470.1 50S ribosomal protein L5 [Dictyoglomaceae bacterium]HPP15426.1 50S ribosomal protein L5 [Dictyoglomaceae bacterium]HPU43202.1 50S ribosomal protein L5 [Dictyoglomaceae bacterium]